MSRPLLAAAAALGACAWANAGQGGPADETMWLRQPSDAEIQAHYPLGADSRRLVGRATIRCRVNSDGDLMDCKLQDESPAGAGFGAAATKYLFKAFRVETGGKGAAWKDRMVSASIDFTPQYYARVRPGGRSAEASQGPKLARLLSGVFTTRYPYQARFTGYSGRVVLHCRIGRGGVAPDCAAVNEWPKGQGFGLAAEQGARHIQVSDMTLDGRTTEGLVLEKVVIVVPSCSDLPAWDLARGGCSEAGAPGHRHRPDR